MELSSEKKLDLYREMVRIRTFENGVRQLITEGRIGHVSFSTGGEAVAVGVCAHLKNEDQIGSTHRPLGHLIAKGSDLDKMMAEIAAKKTGYNKGKGGTYHIFAPEVDAGQQLIEKVPCLPYKRQALLVFMKPGALTDEQDLCLWVS